MLLWGGFLVFGLVSVLSVLHKLGANLGQLLPLIFSFFFPLRMHFGDGSGDFLVLVHINTCFSCEAFIIHSSFLHSDVKLVKSKT